MRSTAIVAMTLVLGFGLTPHLNAQDTAGPSPPTDTSVVVDVARFLAGGAVALAAHETGHLVFDVVFDVIGRLLGARRYERVAAFTQAEPAARACPVREGRLRV